MGPQDVAITAASLIDGSGAAPVADAMVVVRQGRIAAAGSRQALSVDPAIARIDLPGATLMPGMIDLHVHLRGGPDDRMRLGGGDVPTHLDMSLPTLALRGFARARRTLEMGFTTLRDVGDVGRLAVSLRDAVAAGTVEGPRIVACGPNLTATGGSGDYIPDWLERTDVESRVVDGVEGMRLAVRRNVKNGTDWIKFFATGTFGDGGDQDFSDAEMAALCDEAHARGKRVCAHCCFPRGTLAAVRAGIDTVEHGSRLNDEIIDEMLARGTALVPTIFIFDAIATQGAASGMKQGAIDVARRTLDEHVDSFRRAMAAGVKIAMGSDCGNAVTEHGDNAAELELMVRHGMAPMDALVAATRGAAEVLGLDDRIGRLAPRMEADLVAVDGDPLADISILKDPARIALVMKGGEIHRRGG